ncbi:MAG TPA: hypothetical protein VHV82_18700 [Sporichthyaceae bacterium]|nr:hypothetical protein [Sporichthyaceae bacterium]
MPVIDMLVPAVVGDDMLIPDGVVAEAALLVGVGEAPADIDASRATHPARTRTEVITSP